MTDIVCRAKISERCLHGEPTSTQFGEDGLLSDDGTYLSEEGGPGSIVCDPCYMMLMPFTPSQAGLHHEIPDAIELVRGSIEVLNQHPDPSELVRDTEEAMAQSRPGSPYYESARALHELAQRKVAAAS